MTLAKEIKAELIQKYGKNSLDTGSVTSQIAIMTKRIEEISVHLSAHPKDHSSRRGLMKMVSRRKHLLDYLKRKNETAYKKLIDELELRK